MLGFVEHLLTEKTKGDSIEKVVSTLKVLKYGDMLIIKVLDGLGDNEKPSNKLLQSALKKAKVKSKDIDVVVAALNESLDEDKRITGGKLLSQIIKTNNVLDRQAKTDLTGALFTFLKGDVDVAVDNKGKVTLTIVSTSDTETKSFKTYISKAKTFLDSYVFSTVNKRKIAKALEKYSKNDEDIIEALAKKLKIKNVNGVIDVAFGDEDSPDARKITNKEWDILARFTKT